MAAISNLGVGSGLDLKSLLDKLEANEAETLKPISDELEKTNSKFSAFGVIQNLLDAFQAAAQNLANPKILAAVKASVANGSVLSATPGPDAVRGSYAINVTRLAAAQTLVTRQVADQKAAIGGGTITIDFGADLATGGTPASTKTVTIGSDTSLQGIRDAINKADVGVTASIINDGSNTPYRLVLTSNDTGTTSQMRIGASDANVAGLVGFDPAQATQPSGMEEKVKASDAALEVNGTQITSHSNVLTDAIQGVTLTLTQLGTTSMSVTQDDAAIKSAMQSFVSAYNALLTKASELTAFSTEGVKLGDKSSSQPLNGDSTMRDIQTTLRKTLSAVFPDGKGGNVSLSAFGITFNMDTSRSGQNFGKLSIDDTKLDAAIRGSGIQGMSALFGGVDGGRGLGTAVSDYVKGIEAEGGALKVAQDGLTQRIQDLNDSGEARQQRIDDTIARYRDQFANLDLIVARMNQTKAYLKQQFAALNEGQS